MGLSWSQPSSEQVDISTSDHISETVPELSNGEAGETEEERRRRREDEMAKFKEDLANKREARRKKLGEVSDELRGLKDQLDQEVSKRKQLELELNRYKDGDSKDSSTTDTAETKVWPAQVDVLRISKYEEDDDEIDILEEEDDGLESEPTAATLQLQKTVNRKKAAKKRVSFSLELVKEVEENDENRQNQCHQNEANTTPSQNESNNDAPTPVTGQADTPRLDEVQELIIQNKKLENQVKALKDVANLSKQLLHLRETQVEELNNKLVKVEEKEKDYERKMTAMKELRRLYEERSRAMLLEHKHQLDAERTKITFLESKLRFSDDINQDLTDKAKHLLEKVKNLDNQLDDVRNQLSETKIKLATEKEGLYHANSQISLINNLVSQVISGPELDLDRLARFLEDNHALINELTAKGEIDYVASALVGVAGGIVEVPKEEKSDIAENLGKVWRVLVELLSHHKKSDSGTNQEWESCYKSVDTPKGPKLVISVSQTFIKLKDLILEKNSLVKEVGRLKKLNNHLESRMEEQEGRLTLVTEELHNTWDVVNKLKRQHDNLHTHEQILKHELQHKRSMLNGLKKQLETCREQWTLAREKNSKTENDWMLLRAEFASRKKKKLYNSVESGYEEEEIQSPEYDTDEDKSLEIEEESPDNSVGDNNQPTGSASPSETTSESNSILDESNAPISEILDGIFDEAYKIAKSKRDIDKKQSTSPEIKDCQREEPYTEEELPSGFNQPEYEMQNKYSTICDVTFRRLEQIPEVEEDNDNSTKENNVDLEIDNKSVKLSDILAEDHMGSKTSEESGQIDCSTDCKNDVSCDQQSDCNQIEQKTETGSSATDDILRRREERLKRMEESCKSLFVKMEQTSNRSNEISNKLDEIHAAFGSQQSTSQTNQADSTDHQISTNDQSQSN